MIGIVGSIPIPATFTYEDVDEPFWLWWVQTWSRQPSQRALFPFHNRLVIQRSDVSSNKGSSNVN